MELRPVPVEHLLAAWDAANRAASCSDVLPIELGRRLELDGVEMKLTNHPINLAMLAIIKELDDKEIAVAAAFRVWSLLSSIWRGELDRWVDPDRGVMTVLLHAAAQGATREMELDREDLEARAEELLNSGGGTRR